MYWWAKRMIEFAVNTEHSVVIPCSGLKLHGLLYIPSSAKGIVIFAHGSGSGRLSPRNQYIAKELQHLSFATLLFDLLTAEEDKIDTVTAQYRFDINFLATRLVLTTEWLMNNPILAKLPIGYFGASTGGGAALVAGAKLSAQIKAIVSRGGRPDLAGEALIDVEAPTLLIVGGEDDIVIKLNQQALDMLHGKKQLEIIPGATHLFEEAGKLEEVSRLANQWFQKHLK
jgi:dienelactone hydrolase